MKFKLATQATVLVALFAVVTMSAAADYSIIQETQAGSASASRVGQSFTTVAAGHLTQVDLYLDGWNHHAASGRLRIYSGATSPADETSSAFVYGQDVSGMPTDTEMQGTPQWISITLDNPPWLDASTQYTVMLYGNGSQVALRFTSSDVYAGGTRRADEFALSGDIAFRLYFSDVPVELMSFSVE